MLPAAVSRRGSSPDSDVLVSLQRNKDDKVENSLYNLNLILRHDPDWRGTIYFDELDRTLVYCGRPLQDHDVSAMRLWMQRVYNLKFTKTDCYDAMDTVGYSTRVHPVRTYLESLVWDGKERIGKWLRRYCGAEGGPIVDVYGRKWLLAAVMRALKPGCKVDSALIFFGDQGVGKSSSLEILGGEWFSDTALDIGSPVKVGMALRGVWIMELAELSSLRKKEQEEIKAFITHKIDVYRPPYGRLETYNPRTCAFAGTTNSTSILSDPTGSRRYWITEVKNVDRDALLRDRDQLWAEAMHVAMKSLDGADVEKWSWQRFSAFLKGTEAQWWLTDGEERQRVEESHRFEVMDPWLDILCEHVTRGPRRLEFWSNEQIRALDFPGHFNWIRLGMLLEKEGWERHRTSGVRGWRKKVKGAVAGSPEPVK